MTEPTWKDPLLREWFPKCSEETKDHCLRQWRDGSSVSCADVYADLEFTWRQGLVGKPGHLLRDADRLRSLIDAELARGREAVDVLRRVQDEATFCTECGRSALNTGQPNHAPECRLAKLIGEKL